ncbi:MAG TPA: ABC transporter ATP-binding protein [Roseiflexaceae bacterium]|nr:ABC transporter ATP-binding protein [Roseiflexaceae bacterium]HMP40533.1 ABC transporter ATP-binding protein [Roseiflexaceae bacterium]
MIRTENLTKRYENHLAVADLCLDVRAGEIYGFLGPNGAGKTTTIHMLLGLIWPTSGQLFVLDEAITPGLFTYRQAIGVVAEEPAESSKLSGWELVHYFAGLYGVARPAVRMEELFRRLDLWEVRHGLARDYSRGMRQKLSLIRALVHQPRLLILDEPVSGLDPHGIREVRELIDDYRDAGGTVFISSHILSEIEHTADRIGILHEGRLLVEDTMSGIRRRLAQQQRLTIELDTIPDGLVDRLEQDPAVETVRREARRLHLVLRGIGDERPRLSRLITEAGGVILSMQADEMSLEEAFVTITSQNVAAISGVATAAGGNRRRRG